MAPMKKRGGKREDPALPEFWDRRFREGIVPWDAGGIPSTLERFLETEPRGQRVLIPGCGTGYEVRAFAQAGFDVLAIDYSTAAVERARRHLGPLADRVHQSDFFGFDPGGRFDLVYERAFLCALPRRLWRRYAPRVAELLVPKGRLAGFFFFDEGERGPPFGLGSGEIETLLGESFGRRSDAPVADSIPIFAGRERWQVWSLR